MNPIPAAGLLIGAFCAMWMFVMGFTGWYVDPSKSAGSYLVIVFEMGGLIWGLRRTAEQGRTYSGQVAAGALISLIAGIVIIAASLLFTSVVFPDSLRESHAAFRELLAKQGRSEAEIVELMKMGQPTAVQAALGGFAGTFVRGVISSAILAVWLRSRPAAGS